MIDLPCAERIYDMGKSRALIERLSELPRLAAEAKYRPGDFAKQCSISVKALERECGELFGMSAERVLAQLCIQETGRIRRSQPISPPSNSLHPHSGNETAAQKARPNEFQTLASQNVRIVMKTEPISIVSNSPNGYAPETEMDSRAESPPRFWKHYANIAREPRRLLQADAGRTHKNKRIREMLSATAKTTVPQQESRRGPLRGVERGKSRIRVAIVDDEPDMRLILKNLLERTGACACVGTFSNGVDALANIPSLNPDVVMMDIQMPGLDGIECTRRLKQLRPDVKVIMVTGFRDESLVNESSQAGADAFLLKPATAEQCLATIGFILGKKGVAGRLLTAREHEVMQCLVQGLLYKEISDKLKLSYSAIHKHQHKIFLKLQATNRSEAIAKWHKLSGL